MAAESCTNTWDATTPVQRTDTKIDGADPILDLYELDNCNYNTPAAVETKDKLIFFKDQQNVFLAFRNVTEDFDRYKQGPINHGMSKAVFKLLPVAMLSRRYHLYDILPLDIGNENRELPEQREDNLPRYLTAIFTLLPKRKQSAATNFFADYLEAYFKKCKYLLSGRKKARLQNRIDGKDWGNALRNEFTLIANQQSQNQSQGQIVPLFHNPDSETFELVESIAKLLRARMIFSSDLDILRDTLKLLAFGGALYNAPRRKSLVIRADDVREAWGILLQIAEYQTQRKERNTQIFGILNQLLKGPCTFSELRVVCADKSNLYRLVGGNSNSPRSLFKKGLITSRPTEDNPRRYYHITPTGVNYLLSRDKNKLRIDGRG